MINKEWSKEILDRFFNTGYQDALDILDDNTRTTEEKKEAQNKKDYNRIDFPKEVFIALFIKAPKKDGTGWNEPVSPDYCRVSLRGKGPKGTQIMGYAKEENPTEGTYQGKTVAVIENEDIIVFPETETDAYKDAEGNVAPVVAFGVFGESEKGKGTPILWGDLELIKDDEHPDGYHPTIEKGEIPVFRVGEFKFKLA